MEEIGSFGGVKLAQVGDVECDEACGPGWWAVRECLVEQRICISIRRGILVREIDFQVLEMRAQMAEVCEEGERHALITHKGKGGQGRCVRGQVDREYVRCQRDAVLD